MQREFPKKEKLTIYFISSITNLKILEIMSLSETEFLNEIEVKIGIKILTSIFLKLMGWKVEKNV